MLHFGPNGQAAAGDVGQLVDSKQLFQLARRMQGVAQPRNRSLFHERRHLHSHRQQRLAVVRKRPAVQAQFRAQQADHAEGRALRRRFRAVHDQAARLRRQDRVLGPQPGVVHAHGRARGGHQQDQALRHGRLAGDAAGHRGAHVVHHRLHLQRPLRPEPGHRLAAARVLADGHVARRPVLRHALCVPERIHPGAARPLGHRPVRLQGRSLQDGRLPHEPAAAGRHEGDLRRPERRGHGVFGQDTPTTTSASARA
jgi:hypothetical protein